jgi:hypothetical protein
MNVAAALLSLGQAVNLLPKQAKGNSPLWALALVPLLPFFANFFAIYAAESSAVVHVEKHPVEVLAREANIHFESLRQNQSNTYSAAYDKYQRRYGFEPPIGFETWFNFAKSHESPIIDEFDLIYDGITPFLGMSGKEVLESMAQVYATPDHDFWRCVISGQPAKTECTQPRRVNDRGFSPVFDSLIEKFPIPSLDVTFLINHLDEPSVILPPPGQEASSTFIKL